MRSSYLFTSESVSEGHPDKVADQISDAIVDLFLSKDPEARIACETMVTTQRIVVGGEIRCKGVFDDKLYADTHGWAPGSRDEIEQVVRQTVKRIGYEQDGFHWRTAEFENHLHGQSAHIAQGVDATGNKGTFQLHHRVYGKQGEPCAQCSRAIERIVVAQRGTHFCPHCQQK